MEPLQSPEAVQPDAFVELQFNVDSAPLPTLAGFAVSETVGNGATVTATICVVSPPPPVQVRENPVEVVRSPVDCVPLVALLPLQPPEALQLDAFEATQASAEDSPLLMLVGCAVKVSVGATTGNASATTVTDLLVVPPVPVQLSTKLVAADSGPVGAVPDVGLPPLQPPEAMQLDALLELHSRIELSPLATLAGAADSVTVGAGVAAATVMLKGGSALSDWPSETEMEILGYVPAEPAGGMPLSRPLPVAKVAHVGLPEILNVTGSPSGSLAVGRKP